ncbi:SRPBCC family protein [Parvularcula sp. IMCC14364]|uniref:SRPBCC family protein n=1 Tax=Parvularcula sp. IMCC14364 TaxID=3067902 RepID=UPI0027407767|nr:SRPBCC family protein [Parvularcula sp. IMCC14364]
MGKTTATRQINAPVEKVFEAISDVSTFENSNPNIVKIEMLSEQTSGVGTRFRETRTMNGRQATTELEFTEYARNEHVRIVSDAGGTIWDTLMKLTPEGEVTRLDMQMDARPYKLMSRIVTPLISGMVNKAVQEDMDGLKARLEA